MADTTKQPAKNRRTPDRRTGPRAAPGGAVWYVLGFLVLLALAQAFFLQMQTGDMVSYSEFKTLVREAKVEEVRLSEERVRGTLKAPAGARGKPFSAVRVADPKLLGRLPASQPKYTQATAPTGDAPDLAIVWITHNRG